MARSLVRARQVEISKGYGVNEWREDLRRYVRAYPLSYFLAVSQGAVMPIGHVFAVSLGLKYHSDFAHTCRCRPCY
jgi:hypothetical protein